MKNIVKSVFAIALFTLSMAACGPKEKPAAEVQDTVAVEPAVESVDTTATTPADTTAVPAQ